MLTFQATGLSCLHSQGFVHLDIKPGNIFLTYKSSSSSASVAATPLNSRLVNLGVG
jgi:serine/threonine protein kinase